ncbi:hypothetical protein QYE76_009447 [Lolium multiflorum]|uniref:Uncharacterized protein n=1 Tax=Lolium multiflorum TaxID=4521 RepID=A0AAD8X227_LOLMU|nr:hypothetical protein QYE76_009447 [Lolium multiflorum]
MAAVDLGTAEWERSKISTQDINMLKKLGISKKPKALCFPSEESYPTPPMGYRVSFVDHLIRGLSAPIHPFLRGLLFIYEKLAEANKRADDLAQKLERSEAARKKAESDAVQARAEADKAKTEAAGVKDLRKRLHDAETSLSEHIAAQSAREEAVLKRIRTQNRRFVNRTCQEFELEDPDNDPLLDAVSFLEFHGTEAREGIDQAKAGLSRLFPYFFRRKRNPQLSLLWPSALILQKILG